MIRAPGSQLSHYVIESVIGEGMLGVVYRVRDRLDDRTLALKLVRPELEISGGLLNRFVTEVRHGAGANAHVVAIDDAIVLENDHGIGTAFVVTSVFDSSLVDRLAGGPLPIDDALEITHAIASGLIDLHGRGVVHGAIKPSNIVFGRVGVQLADCGWGLLAVEAHMQVESARARYLAPEQCRSAPALEATDLYALGCVLFEMLCGQPPFAGTTAELVEAHVTMPAPRVRTFRPDVPAHIDDVVATMLEKPLAQRPRADALIRILVAPYMPPTGVERELFAAVRARSDDPARLVYADWLEQHGHEARATYLRREPTAPEGELVGIALEIDARWRAAVASPLVSRCGITFGAGCAMRWDALERTEHDRIRTCELCDKLVHFCSSLEEARLYGENHECIAIDSALVRGELLAWWDDAAGGPQTPDWVGEIAAVPHEGGPPVPVPDLPDWAPAFPEEVEPPPPGLFDRVRRWFRR